MINAAKTGGGRDDGAETDGIGDDSELGAAKSRKMNIVETSPNY